MRRIWSLLKASILCHELGKGVKEMKRLKVAFVCVHNSCRSQMAEALGKLLASDVFESYSAGTELRPFHAYIERIGGLKILLVSQMRNLLRLRS